MATYRTTIKFTYDANGGSNAPGATTNVNTTSAMGRTTVSYAITSSKPSPPTGKHFVNWLVRYNGDTYSDISASPANYAYINSGGTQSVTYPASNYGNRTITFIYYASYAWNTYTVSYNANGGSGAPGNQTKTYGQTLKLSTTKPTRTGYTFQGWATSSGGAVAYASGANYTANAGVTLYAVWKEITYTVSYAAAGGSGAPAAQTKRYTANLTLSSTKPTRTGYAFVNWKATNGTTYNPGGTYSTNAATTMTAQWSELTYTVSYNANNGSGAPAAQTKYYTKNLTLQTGVPTRKGYKFLGWATSANATSAAYQPGGTFTTNANTVLYAVWQQTYFAPTIRNLTATRAIADGEGGYLDDDEGHIAHIKFNWTPGTFEGATLTSTCYVDISVQGTTNVVSTEITLTPDTVETWITNSQSLLSDEYAYTIKIRFVTSGWDNVSSSTYISQAYYIMDVNSDGTSVAIGGASKDGENVFAVYMPMRIAKDLLIQIDNEAATSTIDGQLYAALSSAGLIN